MISNTFLKLLHEVFFVSLSSDSSFVDGNYRGFYFACQEVFGRILNFFRICLFEVFTYIVFTYLRLLSEAYRQAVCAAFNIQAYPVSGCIRIVSLPVLDVNVISQLFFKTPFTELVI